jgi:hypothetical protein
VRSGPGTASIFRELLAEVAARRLETVTVAEIAAGYSGSP